jgi:1-aminocyclopropane-1-carboxylate deaminase/D-cysteine desulfhydrase-like pyridoxal-dependent ACC family enzyme
MNALKSKAKRMRYGLEAPTESGLVSALEQVSPHAPTPVSQMRSAGPTRLWLKNDGVLGTVYGGNKVRKLRLLLSHALERGIRRIVTVGAAGSNHVLATTLAGRALGLEVFALMVPQAHTPHAERVLRCSVGQGARILELGSPRDFARAVRLVLTPDVLFLGPGAMGVEGSLSYVWAVEELKQQIGSADLPEPDEIVVAAGSGSTAAGLLVGLEHHALRTRLVAVSATASRWTKPSILMQAWRLARHQNLGVSLGALAARLEVDASRAGAGYGLPTPQGEHATRIAAAGGLDLDPTYTAKAFAAALERSENAEKDVLYWHTLSAQPIQPLLAAAPELDALPRRVRALLRPI